MWAVVVACVHALLKVLIFWADFRGTFSRWNAIAIEFDKTVGTETSPAQGSITHLVHHFAVLCAVVGPAEFPILSATRRLVAVLFGIHTNTVHIDQTLLAVTSPFTLFTVAEDIRIGALLTAWIPTIVLPVFLTRWIAILFGHTNSVNSHIAVFAEASLPA